MRITRKLSVDGIGAYDHVLRNAMTAKSLAVTGHRGLLPFVRTTYVRPHELRGRMGSVFFLFFSVFLNVLCVFYVFLMFLDVFMFFYVFFMCFLVFSRFLGVFQV